MAARTGSEYIERLAASSPTVRIHGETVTTGIPDHPAFRNVVRTYATCSNSHPLRYSRVRNFCASGALVHFIALESHSIFFPALWATLPSRTASARAPE